MYIHTLEEACKTAKTTKRGERERTQTLNKDRYRKRSKATRMSTNIKLLEDAYNKIIKQTQTQNKQAQKRPTNKKGNKNKNTIGLQTKKNKRTTNSIRDASAQKGKPKRGLKHQNMKSRTNH